MPSWKIAFAPAPPSSSNRNARLLESEQRRSLAIAAGKMGSWDWDWVNGDWMWDEGQYRIFGVDPQSFAVTPASVQALLHPDDIEELRKAMAQFAKGVTSYEAEFRIIRPDGEVRWCVGTAAATVDKGGRVVRVSGVTVDITERKHAEERQNLLAREVDHRAKNALALAQSIVRLTRGEDVKAYVQSVEGRINALARVHTILSLSSWQGAKIGKLVDEELAPYAMGDQITLCGSEVQLQPATAQTLALALHELVTNSAKYGALSTLAGRLSIKWDVEDDLLTAGVARDRRAAGSEADLERLRNPKRDRQHRIAARRTGRIRLARRRPDLPALGSAVAASRRAGAGSASERSAWIVYGTERGR